MRRRSSKRLTVIIALFALQLIVIIAILAFAAFSDPA
jgi:hypothetical protein